VCVGECMYHNHVCHCQSVSKDCIFSNLWCVCVCVFRYSYCMLVCVSLLIIFCLLIIQNITAQNFQDERM
jgi:hypothetical protein